MEPKTETQKATEAAKTDASLLDQILSESKLKPTDSGYDVARRGVQAFVTEMLAPGRAQEKVDKAMVDMMIAEVDARLSEQVKEVLHNADFRELEYDWRSMKFLVGRTRFCTYRRIA